MSERIKGLSIGLDLETLQVERGLTGLKDRLKTVNSEMKLNMSAFDRSDKSVGKYEKRLEGLNKKIEVQTKIADEAKKKYEEMVAQHGEGSKEAEKAAREYNKQASTLNDLKSYTEGVRKELAKLKEEQRIANSQWTKTGKKLDETGKKLNKLGNGMKSFGKAWTKGTAVVGAAAIGAGATALTMANKSAEAADRIDKLSQRVGLSREGFQRWDFVLSQSGSSIDSMQTGMKTLSQRMGDAIKGSGKGAEAFERLGVTITDSMSQEEAFEATIRAFQGMEEGIDKADLAQKIFGRTGQDLLPLLNSNRGSLDELTERYDALGIAMGDDIIDAGVKFTDTWDQAKRSFETMGTVIGARAMPVFQNLLDWVIANMPRINQTISGAVDQVIERISAFMKWWRELSDGAKRWIGIAAAVAVAIGPLAIGFGILFNILGPMISTFGQLFMVVGRVGGILPALKLGFAAIGGPVTLIVGAIAALAIGFIALYKNSETFREGVHKLIARLRELLTDALNAIKPAIEAVKQFFLDQLAVIQQFWQENSETIIQALSNIGSFLKVIFDGIVAVIEWSMPFIFAIIESIWGNIKGVITGTLDIIMGAVTFFSGLLTGDFSKMWEGIKQMFSGAITAVWNLIQLQFIGKILKGIGGFVKTFGKNLKDGWTNTIGGIKTFVGDAATMFKKFVDDALKRFNDLVAGAKALPGKIGDGIKSMAGKVSDGIKAVSNKMAESLGKGVNGVIGGVNWVLGKVGVSSTIPTWSVPQYADGTKGHPGGLAIVGDGKGSNAGSELIQTPDGKQYLSPAKDTLVNLPKGTHVLPAKLTKQLLDIPRYALGTIKGWASDAWDGTKKVANNVKDTALDAVALVANPSKAFAKALELFGVTTPSFPGSLKNLGSGLFNKAKDSMKSFLTNRLKRVKIDDDQGFKTGGLINNEGLYRLAEGGWPEWVIPTDPARATEAMKLLALAGKDVQGNKRPNQLSDPGGYNEDNSLLEAVLEQNRILMALLQSSQNIEKKKPISEGDIGRASERYDAQQYSKNQVFAGKGAI